MLCPCNRAVAVLLALRLHMFFDSMTFDVRLLIVHIVTLALLVIG